MKVLFAVNNEEISESIVKKYQKEYKQIISYKNVYYFNAILKELQKDKSYDRIVISEDLESFTHTQYDQIDKFIFEKLDSISDEASNLKGNDTPIILICSDRRTKSETMLVKLFGIGIYNAIIGTDRSVEEVCNLINRPRGKKDAKAYYKIDTDNVNYQAENENDVSEMEIQNIIAHYKRLGKNEDRYIESFNNIAAQYNDTQLRIITKFLPLNVRAVLEEKSPKYQQIMSFNNTISNNLRKTKDDDEGPSQILLKSTNRERILSKPVVIPSSVNMSGIKKLSKSKIELEKPSYNQQNEIPKKETTPYIPKQQNNFMDEPRIENEDEEIENEKNIEEEIQTSKRGRGRPKKVSVEENLNQVQTEKKRRGRPKKLSSMPEEDQDDFILPGLEKETIEEDYEKDEFIPGVKEIATELEQPESTQSKTQYQQENNEYDEEEDIILPGLETRKQQIPTNNINEQSYDNNLYNTNNFQNNYNENTMYSNNNNFQNNYNENTMYSNNNNFQNDYNEETMYSNNNIQTHQEPEIEEIDLSNLLTRDKKIVTFVGTSKNGTSFIVNNIAALMSSIGINTAILDTTQNKNSYYIYTKNEETLREVATHSIEGLAKGMARGIKVNRNLTVYTSLPDESEEIKNVDKILETLLLNHSLILIDTDFNTPINYFKQSQETYLIQTMDTLTIQPLTAFLKHLKTKNVLDERKLRIILNKVIRTRKIKDEVIIGGMSCYNDPSMSFMTELFDKDRIKHIAIPFEEETYVRYLEGIAIDCEISLKGYSKIFIQTLKELGNMIYPIITSAPKNGRTYQPQSINQEGNFSKSMNSTLNTMKRNY